MSGLPDGGRRQGRARRHRGNPTNFCAIEVLGQEMANDEYANASIDAGDVPAVADIETQLEDTRNAVFAKYAVGVQR